MKRRSASNRCIEPPRPREVPVLAAEQLGHHDASGRCRARSPGRARDRWRSGSRCPPAPTSRRRRRLLADRTGEGSRRSWPSCTSPAPAPRSGGSASIFSRIAMAVFLSGSASFWRALPSPLLLCGPSVASAVLALWPALDRSHYRQRQARYRTSRRRLPPGGRRPRTRSSPTATLGTPITPRSPPPRSRPAGRPSRSRCPPR